MNYPAETDIRTTAQALQNHAKEKVVQVQEIVQERAAQAQEQAVKAAHQVEDYVRKNPLNALCLAAGLGLAAVVLVRALTPPPPPRNRAVQLLEDIQQRLYELAQWTVCISTAPMTRSAAACAVCFIEKRSRTRLTQFLASTVTFR